MFLKRTDTFILHLSRIPIDEIFLKIYAQYNRRWIKWMSLNTIFGMDLVTAGATDS